MTENTTPARSTTSRGLHEGQSSATGLPPGVTATGVSAQHHPQGPDAAMRPRGRGGPPVSVSVLLVLAGLLWLHVPTLTAHQILWGRCYSYCIQKHLLRDDRSSVSSSFALC